MTDKKENPFEDAVEFDLGPAEINGEDTDGEASADDDYQALQAALAEAELDVAKHREAMLRIQAESENLRKRLVRDLERSRKLALEGVMKDLLQVRDSMDRGLEIDVDSATVEALLEGQQLTLKMLGKVMKDHHIEVIDPAGEAFNPEFHEAVTVLPTAGVAENTVIEVLQKGFRLHDRLIRPAMVVVSRKP